VAHFVISKSDVTMVQIDETTVPLDSGEYVNLLGSLDPFAALFVAHLWEGEHKVADPG
jgi:hypothetical protein